MWFQQPMNSPQSLLKTKVLSKKFPLSLQPTIAKPESLHLNKQLPTSSITRRISTLTVASNLRILSTIKALLMKRVTVLWRDKSLCPYRSARTILNQWWGLTTRVKIGCVLFLSQIQRTWGLTSTPQIYIKVTSRCSSKRNLCIHFSAKASAHLKCQTWLKIHNYKCTKLWSRSRIWLASLIRWRSSRINRLTPNNNQLPTKNSSTKWSSTYRCSFNLLYSKNEESEIQNIH